MSHSKYYGLGLRKAHTEGIHSGRSIEKLSDQPKPLQGGPFDIHPSVLAASFEELEARGWGSTERHKIPENWRTKRGPGKPMIEPVANPRRAKIRLMCCACQAISHRKVCPCGHSKAGCKKCERLHPPNASQI